MIALKGYRPALREERPRQQTRILSDGIRTVKLGKPCRVCRRELDAAVVKRELYPSADDEPWLCARCTQLALCGMTISRWGYLGDMPESIRSNWPGNGDHEARMQRHCARIGSHKSAQPQHSQAHDPAKMVKYGITESTFAGTVRAAKGGTVYGFRHTINRTVSKKNGRYLMEWIAEPYELGVIEMCRRMHVDGWGYLVMAHELNHRKVPTRRGGPWNSSSLYRILAQARRHLAGRPIVPATFLQ